MLNNVKKLVKILEKNGDNLPIEMDMSDYHYISTKIIISFIEAQRGSLSNDSLSVCAMLVEIDFLIDELDTKEMYSTNISLISLVKFIDGVKYLLLQRKPITINAKKFVKDDMSRNKLFNSTQKGKNVNATFGTIMQCDNGTL